MPDNCDRVASPDSLQIGANTHSLIEITIKIRHKDMKIINVV